MSDDTKDGTRILGFTEHEIELVLMSIQCIKPSKRYNDGWEIAMKEYSALTNTKGTDARAQWKDLSSRLLKLPPLSTKTPSPHHRNGSLETARDCIYVREDTGDDDAAAAVDADEHNQQVENRRNPTRKARAKGKGKQMAKPSILDSIEIGSDEAQSNNAVTDGGDLPSNGDGAAEPPTSDDRVKQAWADIGDGMTEEKWNEMGDKLAL